MAAVVEVFRLSEQLGEIQIIEDILCRIDNSEVEDAPLCRMRAAV